MLQTPTIAVTAQPFNTVVTGVYVVYLETDKPRANLCMALDAPMAVLYLKAAKFASSECMRFDGIDKLGSIGKATSGPLKYS